MVWGLNRKKVFTVTFRVRSIGAGQGRAGARASLPARDPPSPQRLEYTPPGAFFHKKISPAGGPFLPGHGFPLQFMHLKPHPGTGGHYPVTCFFSQNGHLAKKQPQKARLLQTNRFLSYPPIVFYYIH